MNFVDIDFIRLVSALKIWNDILDSIQKELQIVFAIAFSICARIRCDITWSHGNSYVFYEVANSYEII